MHSGVGMLSDHHVRLAPSQIPAFAVAMAKAVLARRGNAALQAALAGVGEPDTAACDAIPTATQGKTFIELLADDDGCAWFDNSSLFKCDFGDCVTQIGLQKKCHVE